MKKGITLKLIWIITIGITGWGIYSLAGLIFPSWLAMGVTVPSMFVYGAAMAMCLLNAKPVQLPVVANDNTKRRIKKAA